MKQKKGKEQEQLQYTTWENTVYMLKNWWSWDKHSFLLSFLRIPSLVLMPMIVALIPKLMIDCITEQASVGRMIVVVAGMALLVAGLSWISPFLQQHINVGAQSVRMHYGVQLLRKSVDTDFENIESMEGRLRQEKSHPFVKYRYSGAQDICEALIQMGVSITGIITYTAVLSKLHPALLLAILLLCFGDYLASMAVRRLNRQLNQDFGPIDMKWGYLQRKADDFSAGKDIRLYRIGIWFLQTANRISADALALLKRFFRKASGYAVLQAFLLLLRDGLAYAYLIYAVIKGKFGVSDFIFYFGLITGFTEWIRGITRQVSNLKRISEECDRYRAFYEIKDGLRRDDGAPLPTSQELPCEITFENVSFSYQGSDQPTIKGMDFHVGRGEKIAIVGVNGAGKTTCIKLLCGLYQPTSGRILINGTPNSAFNRDRYYELFSAVFQDVHFLPMSVAQNVALCKKEEIDEAKLQRVLEKAELWERVQKLDNGLDTMMVKEIHDHAVNFSGGELQKLLLARALYKDAPILVLDEPTAALDPIAENQLYQKYNALTQGKTSFFISHRLSSTRFCDRILFVNDGRIVEEGTHEELMAQKGQYYEMFEIQSHYYQDHPEGGEDFV